VGSFGRAKSTQCTCPLHAQPLRPEFWTVMDRVSTAGPRALRATDFPPRRRRLLDGYLNPKHSPKAISNSQHLNMTQLSHEQCKGHGPKTLLLQQRTQKQSNKAWPTTSLLPPVPTPGPESRPRDGGGRAARAARPRSLGKLGHEQGVRSRKRRGSRGGGAWSTYIWPRDPLLPHGRPPSCELRQGAALSRR
jgi:hypothetical protein